MTGRQQVKTRNGGKKVDVMRPSRPQPDRTSLLASAGGAPDTHAARENTAAGASFLAFLHTLPGRGAKGAFPTGPMGDRVHAMADRSSQDRRARTGEDAQRVACARATFRVGRGGYTASSMYCDTNLGKIVARSTSNSYIRCFLPQPFVPACPIPCPCLRKSSVCACLLYFLCLNRFELSGFCVQSARWVSGFLATRVLPGAIGHSILRISVKPRCIPLSNSQDPELVLLSSHFWYPSENRSLVFRHFDFET